MTVETERELLRRYPRFWDQKIETLPRKDLESLKLKKLKEIVKWAWDNSPLYRRKYKESGVTPDDIRTLEDLRKIPYLHKQELRESQAFNPPFGDSLAVRPHDVTFTAMTTGSTGVPVKLAWTSEDFENDLNCAARLLWTVGFRPIDRILVTYTMNYYWSGHACWLGAMKIGAMALAGGPGNTARHIQTIKDMNVTGLMSVCSYTLYLSETAKKMGVDIEKEWSVRLVDGGGEPGYSVAAIKEKVGKALGGAAREVLVRDAWGAQDLAICAAECHLENGLHFFEDLVVPEVLDPQTGEPVSPGEEGELVCTNLFRKAMPVIRYKLGDIARYDDGPCACGRTSLRLAGGIIGRTDDMLKVKGMIVFPSQIQEIVAAMQQLTGEYRIVIDTTPDMLETLQIEAEYSPATKLEELPEVKERLADAVRSRVFVTPEVTLVEPGTLPKFILKRVPVLDKRREAEYRAKADQQRKVAA